MCPDDREATHAPMRVTIQISDNGVGMTIFSPRPPGEPSSVGIAGRRESVKQLKGEFLIPISIGIGTTIQVVLPLTRKEGTSDGRARSSIVRHPFRDCIPPPSLPTQLSDSVPTRHFLSPRGPL
jgi:hypothetical protein